MTRAAIVILAAIALCVAAASGFVWLVTHGVLEPAIHGAHFGPQR